MIGPTKSWETVFCFGLGMLRLALDGRDGVGVDFFFLAASSLARELFDCGAGRERELGRELEPRRETRCLDIRAIFRTLL